MLSTDMIWRKFRSALVRRYLGPRYAGRLWPKYLLNRRGVSRRSLVTALPPAVECCEPRLLLTQNFVQIGNGDGNWVADSGGARDVQTGLVWSHTIAVDADTVASYDYAANWADNLDQGGYTDWRIPTVYELEAAAAHGAGNHLFDAESRVWSATGSKREHETVNFDNGEVGTLPTRFAYINAIAVRDSGVEPPPREDANVRVYSTTGLDTNGADSSDWFTVALDTRPTSPNGAPPQVTISLTSPAGVTLSTDHLTFTDDDWNEPQWVQVTTQSDIGSLDHLDYQIALDVDDAQTTDMAYHSLVLPKVTVRNWGNAGPSYINIDNISVMEGNEGTTTAMVTVSRTNNLSGTVQVHWETADNWGTESSASTTATSAGDDYIDASGTFTFEEGVQTWTFPILINGDTEDEPDEFFLINLNLGDSSSDDFISSNAIIVDPQARVWILNDDGRRDGGKGGPKPKNRSTPGLQPFSTGISESQPVDDKPASLVQLVIAKPNPPAIPTTAEPSGPADRVVEILPEPANISRLDDFDPFADFDSLQSGLFEV